MTCRRAARRARRSRSSRSSSPCALHRLPRSPAVATDVVVLCGGRAPAFIDGSDALRLPQPLGPRSSYAVTAEIPRLKPADLVARGRGYPARSPVDLALPFPTAAEMTGPIPTQEWRATMSDTSADREWRGLYQLNRQIMGTATDPYQITLRIEQYLRLHYLYSLSPPQTAYVSPYAAFLFDTKIGYCQHFAGAMAALERFNGIPARVALGFTVGDLVGHDTFRVTRTDAHAWVEVYFPHVGWVAFEPTPGRRPSGRRTLVDQRRLREPLSGRPGLGYRGRDRDRLAQAAGRSGRPDRQAEGQRHARLRRVAAPFELAAAVGARSARRASSPGRSAGPRSAAAACTAQAGSAACRQRSALLYGELRDRGVGVPRSQTLSETAALSQGPVRARRPPPGRAHRGRAVRRTALRRTRSHRSRPTAPRPAPPVARALRKAARPRGALRPAARPALSLAIAGQEKPAPRRPRQASCVAVALEGHDDHVHGGAADEADDEQVDRLG